MVFFVFPRALNSGLAEPPITRRKSRQNVIEITSSKSKRIGLWPMRSDPSGVNLLLVSCAGRIKMMADHGAGFGFMLPLAAIPLRP